MLHENWNVIGIKIKRNKTFYNWSMVLLNSKQINSTVHYILFIENSVAIM